MERIPAPPHTNGYHKAPPLSGGAFGTATQAEQPRTVFADDLPPDSLRSYLTLFDQARLLGLRLPRITTLVLAGLAVVWWLGGWSGRWIGAAALLLVAIGLNIVVAYLRRRDFVGFEAAANWLPETSGRLAPTEKIAVFVTGQLSVDAKVQRFTMLPGFYRTFANGEHALMCLARSRAWLGLAIVPVDARGMWYAFVMPASIENLQPGMLRHRRQPLPAIALTYRPVTSAKGKAELQTLYLVCADAGDTNRIVSDLRCQLPDQAVRAATHSH